MLAMLLVETLDARAAAMSSDRLDVTMTYDARHGYIASAPELASARWASWS